MASEGKYVRNADSDDDADRESECSSEPDYEDTLNDGSAGSDTLSESDSSSENENPTTMDAKGDDGIPNTQADQEETQTTPNGNAETLEKIERTQKELMTLINSLDKPDRPRALAAVPVSAIRENWNPTYERIGQAPASSASIRWDHIKPFPSGIAANKMWESWNKYLENFEMAASLGNANDPVQRAQLLFLTMGEELQGIVRAAGLRPKLDEPDCYNLFVKNVHDYLRSMTDTSAEHESFSNMKQEPDESAVIFHARLMEKVRLCGYAEADQERFVRAQLLKGLSNKELAKAARTYGHEINFIVQSAARDEAYQVETADIPKRETDVYAVQKSDWRRPTRDQRKRTRDNDSDGNHDAKRYRGNGGRALGRRSRCSRCNRPAHQNVQMCPALNKRCNACRELGHFVATCRRKQVNAIHHQDSKPARPAWSDDETDKKEVFNHS